MAKQQKIRLVLDPNWYISASINRKSRRTLYPLLVDDRLQILYTDRLLEEFLEVIVRPKFEKIISFRQVQRFIQILLPRLEYVQLQTTVALSRDPKDNYLLALSNDGDAAYLVSGDLDLLVIGQFQRTKIVSMSDFQKILLALQ